ncbi:hypothetical protein LUZ63_009841 [Rhynchospora breviuscula]|uniref:Cytochrome P450 n=1 Tax=Rhynchospora breviuscula TaxID=2022672 RepID=A0A9Q0CFU3_9POAL|nr:hypothetical protein LUZ63_009841 [Rhynchospora breviuscula]
MSLVLLFLFLFPIFLLYRSLFSKKPNLPPSPASLPFVGHLYLLDSRTPHRSLHSLSLSYGKPDSSRLILLNLPSPTLVVSTASAAVLVLKTHDLAFASRPASFSEGTLVNGTGQNVSFSEYGDFWRQSKKFTVVHLLGQKRVFSAPFRAARAEEVTTMMNRIAANKGEMNLSDCFYAYANGVVSRAIAGKGSNAQRFRELMGDISAVLANGSLYRLAAEVFPGIGKLITKMSGLDEKFELYNKNWNQFVAEIIEDKKKTANTKEEDFVDALMRAREDGTAGFDLTENDIIAIIRDMTAAATDTTFITLEWIMSELMKNLNVMAKAQTEIRQIAGKKPMVTEDDLNQIEYIRAVIKEAMRLHPPAPLLVPHESTTSAVIHGYEIPPKTKLIINAWAIARDPQSWETPEEFRPERFLGSEVDFRGNDFQFIPFGAGRRMCPGINFAMVTIELALANLLYHFDWRLPGRDLDMDEAVGISVPRKNPLYLIATKA